MESLAIFIGGVIVGAVIVFIISRFRQKDMEKSFSALSFEALRKNSEEFLKLAHESLSKQTQTGVGELESKKNLIDQTLAGIKDELNKVGKSVTDFDSKREKTFGELTTQLKTAVEQTGKLQETTNKLQLALANTKTRGQWGERMAEDIFRSIGFLEGINYLKQVTQENTASRPDFTFILPQDLQVNMDVKFPLDNYLKYVNEETEPTKTSYKEQFLKDTRQRIKEVTTRDYINPEKNTVDYVLVFIPNEQVYCFIHENDRSLLDEALSKKVILCSPLTLYAILAVMKQAVENFNLKKTEAQILSLFGTFNRQWGEFKKSMERVGERIKQADSEYEKLASTRSRMLERPLNQIDALRKQRGILESPPVEDVTSEEDRQNKQPS
ncbi:MAG: DNA recombination protein RmuC [Chloroflexota bacterium]